MSLYNQFESLNALHVVDLWFLVKIADIPHDSAVYEEATTTHKSFCFQPLIIVADLILPLLESVKDVCQNGSCLDWVLIAFLTQKNCIRLIYHYTWILYKLGNSLQQNPTIPFPPLLDSLNDNGVLPFISEECVNPCILPPLCMHSSHIYQLREVLSAVSVSTEEPGLHLGRPGELQRLLGTTDVCLEATHSRKDLLLLTKAWYDHRLYK